MTRRQSVRTDLLDWWQAVLDETKELVDDNIDRLRGPETRREAEVDELRQQISELTAAVEAMAPPDDGRSSKGR
jgi:hypothetical protein